MSSELAKRSTASWKLRIADFSSFSSKRLGFKHLPLEVSAVLLVSKITVRDL
jgi:hypothetical protein